MEDWARAPGCPTIFLQRDENAASAHDGVLRQGVQHTLTAYRPK